jgi:hypothetical protein
VSRCVSACLRSPSPLRLHQWAARDATLFPTFPNHLQNKVLFFFLPLCCFPHSRCAVVVFCFLLLSRFACFYICEGWDELSSWCVCVGRRACVPWEREKEEGGSGNGFAFFLCVCMRGALPRVLFAQGSFFCCYSAICGVSLGLLFSKVTLSDRDNNNSKKKKKTAVHNSAVFVPFRSCKKERTRQEKEKEFSVGLITLWRLSEVSSRGTEGEKRKKKDTAPLPNESA